MATGASRNYLTVESDYNLTEDGVGGGSIALTPPTYLDGAPGVPMEPDYNLSADGGEVETAGAKVNYVRIVDC